LAPLRPFDLAQDMLGAINSGCVRGWCHWYFAQITNTFNYGNRKVSHNLIPNFVLFVSFVVINILTVNSNCCEYATHNSYDDLTDAQPTSALRG
jgi:hypothetical protein